MPCSPRLSVRHRDARYGELRTTKNSRHSSPGRVPNKTRKASPTARGRPATKTAPAKKAPPIKEATKTAPAKKAPPIKEATKTAPAKKAYPKKATAARRTKDEFDAKVTELFKQHATSDTKTFVKAMLEIEPLRKHDMEPSPALDVYRCAETNGTLGTRNNKTKQECLKLYDQNRWFETEWDPPERNGDSNLKPHVDGSIATAMQRACTDKDADAHPAALSSGGTLFCTKDKDTINVAQLYFQQCRYAIETMSRKERAKVNRLLTKASNSRDEGEVEQITKKVTGIVEENSPAKESWWQWLKNKFKLHVKKIAFAGIALGIIALAYYTYSFGLEGVIIRVDDLRGTFLQTLSTNWEALRKWAAEFRGIDKAAEKAAAAKGAAAKEAAVKLAEKLAAEAADHAKKMELFKRVAKILLGILGVGTFAVVSYMGQRFFKTLRHFNEKDPRDIRIEDDFLKVNVPSPKSARDRRYSVSATEADQEDLEGTRKRLKRLKEEGYVGKKQQARMAKDKDGGKGESTAHFRRESDDASEAGHGLFPSKEVS